MTESINERTPVTIDGFEVGDTGSREKTRGSTADTIRQEAGGASDTSGVGLPRWLEMVCALSRSHDLTRDIFFS